MVGWIIQILQHVFKDVVNHITAEKSEPLKHKNGLEHMTLADIKEKAAGDVVLLLLILDYIILLYICQIE